MRVDRPGRLAPVGDCGDRDARPEYRVASCEYARQLGRERRRVRRGGAVERWGNRVRDVHTAQLLVLYLFYPHPHLQHRLS